MIDLTRPTLRIYQDEVDKIYKILGSVPWCPVITFERMYRKISLLNSKINNRATDIRKRRAAESERDYY